MKFCSQCGSKQIFFTVPAGDNRERHVCQDCDVIFYENPRIICGCIATFEDKVLLCKRAIEPKYGLWTLPAGFMENQETTEEAAIRETLEETTNHVTVSNLYTVLNVPEINQVYFFFRADIKTPSFEPTSESSEVKLFTEDEIPWSQLAFGSVTHTLTQFFQDRQNAHYPIHVATLRKNQNAN